MIGGSSGGVGPMILELPLEKIRRPLMRTRSNDQNKVKELMDSIRQIGLQVPVKLLTPSLSLRSSHLISKLNNLILVCVTDRCD